MGTFTHRNGRWAWQPRHNSRPVILTTTRMVKGIIEYVPWDHYILGLYHMRCQIDLRTMGAYGMGLKERLKIPREIILEEYGMGWPTNVLDELFKGLSVIVIRDFSREIYMYPKEDWLKVDQPDIEDAVPFTEETIELFKFRGQRAFSCCANIYSDDWMYYFLPGFKERIMESYTTKVFYKQGSAKIHFQKIFTPSWTIRKKFYYWWRSLLKKEINWERYSGLTDQVITASIVTGAL